MQKVNDSLRKLKDDFRVVWLVPAVALLGVFISLTLYTFSNAGRDWNNYTAATGTQAIAGNPPPAAPTPDGPYDLTAKVSVENGVVENRTATYQGISFNYNTSLASEIKAEIRPAYALNYETDKPDSAAPEHIVFQFRGAYASGHESSSFSPQIIVYPVAGYKKALAKSQSYVRQFEDEIKTLQTMLSTRPTTWEDEIPLLPFGSASQEFHARVKYLSFQNGRGVMFLTQYNIEPALVNNEGLTYTFQGLTEDGTYYVSATFPVRAPFLPEHYGDEQTDNYTLVPPRSYEGAEYEAYKKRQKSYLTTVIRKLEALPANDYQPNLILLEEMMQSLNVKPIVKAQPERGRD